MSAPVAYYDQLLDVLRVLAVGALLSAHGIYLMVGARRHKWRNVARRERQARRLAVDRANNAERWGLECQQATLDAWDELDRLRTCRRTRP